MRFARVLPFLAIMGAIALGASLTVSASAATTDVLTYGSEGVGGGTNVAVGAVLTSTLKSGTSATFTGANGHTFICKDSTITEKVTSNPAAPSTAGISVTGISFGLCTTNFTPTLLTWSITGLPAAGTVSSSGSVKITGTIVASFRVTVNGTTSTCNYAAGSLSGTNTFTNQSFTRRTGSSSGCDSSVTGTSSFAPPKDTSVSGTPQVYVNLSATISANPE